MYLGWYRGPKQLALAFLPLAEWEAGAGRSISYSGSRGIAMVGVCWELIWTLFFQAGCLACLGSVPSEGKPGAL